MDKHEVTVEDVLIEDYANDTIESIPVDTPLSTFKYSVYVDSALDITLSYSDTVLKNNDSLHLFADPSFSG
jgi:hypothetical protein